MSDEDVSKYIDISPASRRRWLLISCDKVIIKEKGVEIISETISNFVAQVDKLIFIGEDGERAVYVKEVKKDEQST